MSATSANQQPPIPRSHVIWFFALALLGVAADLWTKHLVFRHPALHRGREWWLWEGHVGIQKSLNEGALAGMGQGNVRWFVVISIAAAVAIPIWLFHFRAASDRWLTVALGCVFGGILGNLYDRVGLPGLLWDEFNLARQGEAVYAVRDWILVQWNPEWVWPNFNIADSLLVLGAGVLMMQALLTKDSETESDSPVCS